MVLKFPEYYSSKPKSKKDNKKIFENCDNIIQQKIVIFGPSSSGKTEIFKRITERFKNNLINKHSIETVDGKTLYQDSAILVFDFYINDLKNALIIQVITCPGAKRFQLFLRHVLGYPDGVIFVADSNPKRIKQNIKSFHELICMVDPKSIPYTIQLNKRDLDDAISKRLFKKKLGFSDGDNFSDFSIPIFNSIATQGKNVIECFQDLVLRLLIKFLANKEEINGFDINFNHSIWIKFHNRQDKNYILKILNEKYPLEKYNTVSPNDYNVPDRYCQDGGYTFKDKQILREFVENTEHNNNEPLPWNCEYSLIIKKYGEAIIYLFSINIDDKMVGRDLKIWDMGFNQYNDESLNQIRYRYSLLEAERRLLFFILEKLKKLLENNGIKCYLEI